MTIRIVTLLTLSFVLPGCGPGEGSMCSPVSSERRCLGTSQAYECQGPADAKGAGTIRIIEDCSASGKVCAAFTSQDGSCMDKAEYCALNITPKPAVCR